MKFSKPRPIEFRRKVRILDLKSQRPLPICASTRPRQEKNITLPHSPNARAPKGREPRRTLSSVVAARGDSKRSLETAKRSLLRPVQAPLYLAQLFSGEPRPRGEISLCQIELETTEPNFIPDQDRPRGQIPSFGEKDTSLFIAPEIRQVLEVVQRSGPNPFDPRSQLSEKSLGDHTSLPWIEMSLDIELHATQGRRDHHAALAWSP